MGWSCGTEVPNKEIAIKSMHTTVGRKPTVVIPTVEVLDAVMLQTQALQ